jgi:phage tail protein X
MADRPKVQKAEIIKADDPSIKVSCHFNPDEFTLKKTIKWNENPDIGGNASELRFGGGKSENLTITLLFDSTDTGNDVRKSYEKIFDMASVDSQKKNSQTNLGEPPKCMFQWGKFLSFTAVIESIEQKFIMFKADGTPLRANVTVSFKEVNVEPTAQNPTSHSEARKTWIVREGETLDWIAYKEYGNSAQWRHIAEANGLIDDRDLIPGQILRLTPLT